MTQKTDDYKIDQDYLHHLLVQIGFNTDKGNQRVDADDTQFLARELEFIRQMTFDILFPDLRAREFIPVDNTVDSSADTVTYRQWEMFGAAAVISNYADDSPRVDTLVREFSGKVRSLGASYGYSIMDLRGAVRQSKPLVPFKAETARRATEQTMDQIAAEGDAAYNLPGFLNFVNVPIIVLPNGNWPAATSVNIIEDLNFGPTSIRALTQTVHSPDTLLLDTATFDLIAQKPVDVTNGSNISILNLWLTNQQYVRNVDQWYRLDTAGPADTPRIMFYERSPRNMMLVIPQEFEQFPPQARNLEFVVNTHARIGGVEWHYPLSAAYADNHDS